MNIWHARFLVLCSLVIAGALLGQDAVTVGTVTADDATVDVPVYIRDVSGTPLGMDKPAGSKIQSFSIKVVYAPASAVSSVTFSRAGITNSLSPTLELSPSGTGSISLLETFQENTNPIPFTLNAGAPGNLVAHLVFKLSPGAAPGTPISLTIDSGLTQLTDSGGSAATKETEANGQLALVDGQILIPVPALTITPNPFNIGTGDSGSLRITSSTGVIRSTSIALTSSHPEIASLPASITLPAGLTHVDVSVSGVTAGSAIVTATLPESMGGASANATVNVAQTDPLPCLTPSAPQLAVAGTSPSNATYAVTWSPVANATEFIVDESTDAAFAGATQKTVSGTSASYTHGVSSDTRFYYRARARNHAADCDLTSGNSNVVSILVQAPAGPVQLVRVIPVVGSVMGQAGSNFKTSMQLFNPRETPISGNVVLHRSGTPDVLLPYVLGAGKGVAYDDLLVAMGTGGIGTADLLTDAGSALPVSFVRVFNDGGAAGTSGLSEDALDPNSALQAGESGSIIAPTDFVHFRLNIGVRTLLGGASFTATARDRDGIVVKSVERSYGATFFGQVTSTQLLDGYVLTGGESITFTMHSGSAFIYGATTDNITNDPTMQLARRGE